MERGCQDGGIKLKLLFIYRGIYIELSVELKYIVLTTVPTAEQRRHLRISKIILRLLANGTTKTQYHE